MPMNVQRILGITVLLLAGGCGSLRPGPGHRPAPSLIDLAAYQPAVVPVAAVYARRDLRRPEQPVARVWRRWWSTAAGEGDLTDRPPTPLATCIAPAGQPEPAHYFPWPAAERADNLGVLLAFSPPVPSLPEQAPLGETDRVAGKVEVWDRWGHSLESGTYVREVSLLGFEPVVVRGSHRGRCLHVRRRLLVTLHWQRRVVVTEHLWLAPGLGPVRRLGRVRVFVFPLYLDASFADELTRVERSAADRPHPVQQVPRWARAAVWLDPLLPHLSLGGMLIEYADPVAGVPLRSGHRSTDADSGRHRGLGVRAN